MYGNNDTGVGTLGARLFQPKRKSLSIGWTIRAGKDFPNRIKSKLEAWNTTFQFIEDPDQPSTRGCLEYLDESHDSNSSFIMSA